MPFETSLTIDDAPQELKDATTAAIAQALRLRNATAQVSTWIEEKKAAQAASDAASKTAQALFSKWIETEAGKK